MRIGSEGGCPGLGNPGLFFTFDDVEEQFGDVVEAIQFH
jgi:hypothetical protein